MFSPSPYRPDCAAAGLGSHRADGPPGGFLPSGGPSRILAPPLALGVAGAGPDSLVDQQIVDAGNFGDAAELGRRLA